MSNCNQKYSAGRKLLSGIIKFSIGLYIIYFVGVEQFQKMQGYFFNFLCNKLFFPVSLSNLISSVLFIIAGWYSIKFFIVGLLQILLFNQQLSIMGDRPNLGREIKNRNNSEYPNIERALKFRDSAMSGMNDAKASEYYQSTSKIDRFFADNSGKNTKRALGYMNSKMAGMNDAKAVDYLRGKK